MRGMKSAGLIVRIVSLVVGLGLSACGGSVGSGTAASASSGSAPAAGSGSVSGAGSTSGTGGTSGTGAAAAAMPVEPDPLLFSASNYSVAQDAGLVYLTIIRVGSATSAVSVQYSTMDGTALAGTDYTAAAGTLQWEENDSSSRTIFVPLMGTSPYAGAKNFTVALSNPSLAAQIAAPDQAVVTISGTAGIGSGNLQFSDPGYSVYQTSPGLVVTVNRTGGLSGSTSVQFATTDGSAHAGVDYGATSGTLNWSPGDGGSKTFVIPILGVLAYSGSKTFGITLSNPTAGATLGFPGVANVTIAGAASPSAGSFELSSPSYAVAQAAGTLSLTVNRTGGTSGQASVAYATSGGTAVAGSDFTAASGVLTWADGDATPQTIALAISAATPFSGNRLFSVGLFAPTGGATIRNPGVSLVTIAGSGTSALGSVQFSLSSYIVAQGSGPFSAGVERIGGSSGAISVQYTTQDGSALAGTDYTAASGVLQWADGDSTPKVLNIPVSTATPFSGTKSFSLLLSNAGGGVTIGNPGSAAVAIQGDAVPAATSLQLSLSSYVVAQGAGLFSASVERTGSSSGAISVQYSTVDGTALAGVDYTATSALLQWADGDTTPKVFNIPVSRAVPFSGTKAFSVVLSNPTGGADIANPGTAAVVLMGAATTPIVTNTPANILSYLKGLNQGSSHRVLSGQHASIWNTPLTSPTAAMDVVTPLPAQTGQNPAILGLVLNYATDSYAVTPEVTDTLANEWWSRGGMVLLSLYDNDPTFSYNSSGAPIGQPIPAGAFHQLTIPTSAAYIQWHSQLDTYAAALHTLTDSGNTVLFRPFIEINGNWNWYGAENPADFIAVWQDMYQYLMVTKGLKNVLWVYNVNGSVGQYMAYYPGANYVDIVGMDIYDYGQNIVADANTGGMYQSLVATGKPLIFPEIGLAPPPGPADDTQDNMAIIDDIRSSLPNVVGFVVFNGTWAICNQNNASLLMNDPWIVDLADLPSGL